MLTSTCFQITKVTISQLVKTPTERYQFVIKFKIIRYGNVSPIRIFLVK